MLSPSFYAIYKQGRFGRSGAADLEVRINQIERFSVSALAFVLHHDLEFLEYFLRQVCGCSSNPELFHIDIEVSGCGDLVLHSEVRNEVYAIEFKVGAPIQDHNQSPHNPSFFTSGYGAGIVRKYGNTAAYVVVSTNRQEGFDAFQNTTPPCISRTWETISCCPKPSSIVRDLFESFAALNIPAFTHMITKNLTVGGSGLNTACMYHLLDAVVAKVGFLKPTIDSSLNPDAKGGYFGFDFRSASSPLWDQLVDPIGSIGWFGYDKDCNADGNNLIVWFYCGTTEARARIQSIISERFNNVEIKIEDEGDVKHILAILPAEKSSGDQEWFISIFDALVPCE